MEQQLLSIQILKAIVQRTTKYPSPLGEFMAMIGFLGGTILIFPLMIMELIYLYGKMMQNTLGSD